MKFLNTLRVYNKKSRATVPLFYGTIIVVLILSLINIHPGTKARVKQQVVRDELIAYLEEVKSAAKIDAQEWWQLREQLSPGFFTINESHLTLASTYQIQHLEPGLNHLLEYHSPRVKSHEYICSQQDCMEQLIANLDHRAIIKQPNLIIIDQDTQLTIWKLFSIDEMQSAIGLFDYLPSEMELLANSYWLHYSIIKL